MKGLSDRQLLGVVVPWLVTGVLACAEPEPLLTDETIRNGTFLTQFANEGSVPLTDGESRVSVVEGSASTAAMARSAPSTSGLGGIDWKLVAIETEEGVVTPVMTRQGDPTLRFEAESSTDEVVSGRFTGGSGCNRIFASFDAGPGAELAVGPIASTRMMCPEHVMVVEALFLSSLQIASSYSVNGDELEIRFPDGAMTLVAAGS